MGAPIRPTPHPPPPRLVRPVSAEGVKVSFHQNDRGIRTVYVQIASLAGLADGSRIKRKKVCELPLINVDYNRDGHPVGIEVVAG